VAHRVTPSVPEHPLDRAIHVQQVEQELRRAGIDLVLLREKIDGSAELER
jgi:hypothetical protein